MKLRRSEFSPQSKRALELLNDPKWSWNRFPRKQINWVLFTLHSPHRAVRLVFYNIIDKIAERICK